MRINYYLRDKKPGKKCAIRIHLKINGVISRIPTGFYSTPENWNTKKQLPRDSHPDYQVILAAINSFNTEIGYYFSSKNLTHSKQGLLEFLNQEPQTVFLHELAEHHYIKQSKKKATLDYYKDFLQHLKANTPNVSIHEIDQKFWGNYTDNLLKRSHSTRQQYQKHVKAVLNSALKAGLTKNSSFHDFAISPSNQKKESTPRLSFSKEEISELAKINFRTPSRNVMRDKICLFCFLGLRVSDWEIALEDIDFENNVIRNLNRKTSTEVTLPIFKQAFEILEKNNFTIAATSYQQKYWAFRKVMIDAKDSIPTLRQRFKTTNTEGKVVFKEKWQLINLHDIRRTYCTWLYKAKSDFGVTEREIMQLSGHTSLSEFLKYINLTKEEVALKVNLKIAEMAANGLQF